jgi:hypothetical protein
LPSIFFGSHDTILIRSFANHLPEWSYEQIIIRQNQEFPFCDLVTKWQLIVKDCWKEIERKLYQELGIYSQDVDAYLCQEQFVNFYNKHHEQVISDISELNEISPQIESYIRLKCNYMQPCKPNIFWYTIENVGNLSFTFGNDITGHHLVLQSNLFSTEFIEKMHKPSYDDTDFYIISTINDLYPSRLMYKTNLLHMYLTQALSIINHNHDYFAKMLRFFSYRKKEISIETQNLIYDYTMFLSYLESTLQSKNPLEAALYWQPIVRENTNASYVLLWENLITDIELSYHDDDLIAYQNFSKNKKQAELFTYDDDVL